MKRSKFSLSHYNLFSMKMGGLYPCGVTEVLPGDSIQHAVTALVRTAPLVSPPMHPCHVRIHHWFVPYRLIWGAQPGSPVADNTSFESFITGGPDGNDASVFPTVSLGNVLPGNLADYLGIGQCSNAVSVSALPFRAYALIFNEWYRDQDLVTALPISFASGVDSTTPTVVQSVAWEKDYFTTCRPWTQKGPTVTLPLGTSAPVLGDPGSLVNFRDNVGGTMALQSGAPGVSGNPYELGVGGGGLTPATNLGFGNNSLSADGLGYEGTGLVADLGAASAVNINDLREALALQRYEEARARYGSRYTEYLRYLGVRSSDARLMRPEYLGGGKQTLQFSEVLQTGGTSAGGQTGVGNLAGHGINATRSNRYRRFFEEHGLIMTLISVKPITVYADSANRMWYRRTKEDFFQRELQFIGQQPVYNAEVYANAVFNPANIFGFQDRYDEYRRQESRIASQFRTLYNSWHFAREFSGTPVLNSSFVTCSPSILPFADQTGDDTLLVMANHSMQARRIVSASAEPRTF